MYHRETNDIFDEGSTVSSTNCINDLNAILVSCYIDTTNPIRYLFELIFENKSFIFIIFVRYHWKIGFITITKILPVKSHTLVNARISNYWWQMRSHISWDTHPRFTSSFYSFRNIKNKLAQCIIIPGSSITDHLTIYLEQFQFIGSCFFFSLHRALNQLNQQYSFRVLILFHFDLSCWICLLRFRTDWQTDCIRYQVNSLSMTCDLWLPVGYK